MFYYYISDAPGAARSRRIAGVFPAEKTPKKSDAIRYKTLFLTWHAIRENT